MLFSDIIATLGIAEYPALLREIYERGESVSDFTEETVNMLDDEYSIIGACKDKIIACYKSTIENEALWEYTKAAAARAPSLFCRRLMTNTILICF